VADNLRGIKAVDPLTADRLESQAARRVEFLAGKLPKRPRVAVGNWQPPNSEIRKFARYVAAVEDPSSVLERAASGTISPEGAEALRTVYPEQFADIQRQVIETLPELRDKLPRDKRIALSILTGIPIDPAMEPRILARLQATYATEPGTEGGAQAPTPQPSFGSVSREQPTKAQRRAGDERTA